MATSKGLLWADSIITYTYMGFWLDVLKYQQDAYLTVLEP